jgi:ADP-heptose:LPS heptosyltransferase
MSTSPQTLLVVHVASLAQTTLALPALHALRQHLPRTRITVASSAAADLLKLAGYVDEVLPVSRLRHAEFLALHRFYRSTQSLRALRRTPFELAVTLQTGKEADLVLQIARPYERLESAGASSRGLGALLDRVTKVLAAPSTMLTHLAHEYLRKLEPLGVRPTEAVPRLFTDRAADERLEKLLNKHNVGFGELLIGIHPGAGEVGRRWPLERFASIGARMIHNFNARVLVFAGPQERGTAKRLAKLLPAKRAIVFESPKLPDLVSAFARLSLLIANHSGPAHVAAALGTPVVAVSTFVKPSATDLLSSRHEQLRGLHVDLISEETVYEAACRLLKMNRAEFLRSR